MAKRPKAEPQTAADLVPQMLRRLGGQGRVAEHEAIDAWPVAVGAVLRARTAPERLREGILTVRVASSAVAHEIVLLRGQILARLAEAIGPGLVKDIRTRVGDVKAP